ncbi:MAG: TonB-dependent receptor [Halopseudomonas sp.]
MSSLLSPLTAQASIDELITEEDLFGGIPTVKSATRLEQKLSEIPAAVTIIDREMIEASGAVNIADLFKLVPGFQSYHVNANKFGVVSHGMGEAHPGRLEVMIDGRSVYQPALSSVDWSALGVVLDDIKYIEVVRGPNVATQGSNAFLGAINITTYAPLDQTGSAIRTTVGALDTREVAFRHNNNIGSFNYRLGLNYHKNEGTGIGQDVEPPFLPSQMEDGAEISQLNLHGLYTPNLSDSFVIQLGVSDGTVGVGGSNHPADFTPRDVKANYQNLSWDRIISPEQQLRVQASHSRNEYDNEGLILLSDLLRREIDAFAGAPQSAIEAFIAGATGGESDQLVDEGMETGVTERYDVEVQLTQEWDSALRLVAGVGLRHDRFSSMANLGHDRTLSSNSQRLFGNLEWRFSPDWIANAGAMLEHHQDTEARFSPRLGLNWHVAEQQTVRASISRAYRAPSLMEQQLFAALILPSNGQVLDINTYTPDELDPERVDALELGYLIEAPSINSVFDLKAYVEEVSNGLAEQWTYTAAVSPDPSWVSTVIPDATDPDQKALQIANNATWRTKGLEAQWKLQPWSHTWFFLGYAYTDTQGQYDRRSGAEFKLLSERTPTHGFSLLASHSFGHGFEASAGFYRQTSVKWHQGSDLKPYNRLDGRLAKNFKAGDVQGSLEFILQSFNSPYTEFEVNNTVDTRGFVRLSLDFL